MIRRSPKSGSAVDKQQEELAQRENALRDRMQKLQRMIDDAPRLAQETSRKQREELLERANQRGSRLDDVLGCAGCGRHVADDPVPFLKWANSTSAMWRSWPGCI